MKRALAILLTVFTAGPALAAGRASLNVYFQSNLKDTAYQKKTFDRVVKAWKAPAASQVPEVGKKTVVQSVIAKDGKLVSAVVSMSSGKKGWDAAALAAVRTAAPFDPLPARFAAPYDRSSFPRERRAVGPRHTTPNSFPTATNASTASSRSASVWIAEIWQRRRAWPFGTTGKPKPET